MGSATKKNRFEAMLAKYSAATPGHAEAVDAHKAASAAYAKANPTRVLTASEMGMRDALAGSDDGWGDFCSPRSASEA